ncbi:MAG: hypothetical protein ABEJ74_04715 [Haloferacaceae archaeon]
MRALPVVVALLVLAPTVGMSAGPLASPETGAPGGTPVAAGGSSLESPTSDATARFWAVTTPQNSSQGSSNETTSPSGAEDSDLNRTTNVLDIPPNRISRSTHDRHAVDLGPAIGFASNATSSRLATLTVLERVERVEPARRKAAIQRALEDIDDELVRLRQREQAAIGAYSAGTITSRELLIRLARIDIRARSLSERRAALVDLAERDGIDLDQARLAVLERRTDALTGPVRGEAVSVLKGASPPSRFYVETGPRSVVLTTVIDDTYVREAFRGDRYNPGGRDINPERALDIVAESYPVIWETRRNNTEVTGSQGNYLVTVPHERGVLIAFVDGDSERVYKEFQRRPLATMDDFEGVSAAKDGLRLTVNRSYPGAPLHVTLVDVESGRPIDANVTIGQGNSESELVGQTGSEGELWTLSPRGRYTITAIRGNSVVVLTVDPAATPLTETPANETTANGTA